MKPTNKKHYYKNLGTRVHIKQAIVSSLSGMSVCLLSISKDLIHKIFLFIEAFFRSWEYLSICMKWVAKAAHISCHMNYPSTNKCRCIDV